ncbi:hypothetical protein L682_11090 [Aquipseudomonas alcaligenes OT 69]|nr:hypothetical protein L682_11090 [Pseudomonas alcaligenes OT 69]
MREAFADAVAKAGGQRPFAQKITTHQKPVSQQLVSYWMKKGRLPAEYVLIVERITGVNRLKLRPDVFTEPPTELSA